MNWSIKEAAKVLLVIAVLSGGMLSGVSNVRAPEKGGTLAQQIQGSWTLVSCVNEKDGQKFDVFGPNPKGLFVLTSDGRVSHILMRASLPKFASNSRIKGTAEENQAVVQGSIAFFGRYTVVSEKDKTVNLTIEGSTFPNQDGQTQMRIMTVVGDELRVTNPTPTIGSGTTYLIWKRAK
jgi:hypothetical protein